MLAYSVFDTAWGAFGYVAEGAALIATYLPGLTKAKLQRRIRNSYPGIPPPVADLLPQFERQVRRYFDGDPARFSESIDLNGVTPFRAQVLRACRRIPYGKTASYADLARAVGRAGAGRAVGSTMATNPLPLVIPCHRVMRSDGGLGGFSSPRGVDQKRRMLELEAGL